VLPEFLDLKGRNSLSPASTNGMCTSDPSRASRAPLRHSLLMFSGKTRKPAWSLCWRVSSCVVFAEGKLPRQRVLEQEVSNPGGPLSHWTALTLSGEEYKKFAQ